MHPLEKTKHPCEKSFKMFPQSLVDTLKWLSLVNNYQKRKNNHKMFFPLNFWTIFLWLFSSKWCSHVPSERTNCVQKPKHLVCVLLRWTVLKRISYEQLFNQFIYIWLFPEVITKIGLNQSLDCSMGDHRSQIAN